MDLSPSLDSWTTFFLIAAAQGVFLALVLFFARPEPRHANRWLGALLLCFSIILIDYVGFWSGYHYYFPYFIGIYLPLTFLLGPLLYFHVRRLAVSFRKPEPFWLHFLPAFLLLGWRLPFHLLPAAAKQEQFARGFLQMYDQPPPLLSITNLLGLLIIGHLSYYAVKINQIARHEESFAGQQKLRRKKWLRTLQVLFLSFIGAYLAYYLLLNTAFFNIFQDYTVALAMAVCIYAIGYISFAHRNMLSSGVINPAPSEPKYQHSTLTPGASQSLADKLLEYMDDQQPYLDNELRLSSLAGQLGVSKHHLSQVINEQLGKHFSEFVNDYRVKEAQRLLRDPEKREWPVIEIAYAAGFNNKTSFYQAFKAIAGCAPTAYRRRLRQESS